MDGLPVFFPEPEYVPELSRSDAVTLRELCRIAQVGCRASGAWTERPVRFFPAENSYLDEGRILAEPQGGAVHIHVPQTYCGSSCDMARYALGAMAYSSLFDLVARESIKHAPWRKCFL